MNSNKVHIECFLNASINKAWEYWTLPEHIVNWNFASDDWHCPYANNDLKVGGKSSSRMEAKDGSFGFDFTVVYDEIIEHKKISYTMEDGRQATTLFTEDNGLIKVQTDFDPEKVNPIELQQGGWKAILNNFKKYVESN